MYLLAGQGLGKNPVTLDVDKAVKANRYYSKNIGWQKYRDIVSDFLSKSFGLNWTVTNEYTFAAAVARWQESQGLPADGVIGTTTWLRLLPTIDYFPSPITMTLPKNIECPDYMPQEKEISRTQRGLLSPDVRLTGEGLLIGDFGVDSHSIKDTTKEQLKPWLHTFEMDPSYHSLRILGYSDCVGKEKNNKPLRKDRAQRVYELLGKKARAKVLSVGPASLESYVSDNSRVTGRANNRGVMISFTRQYTFPPEQITGIKCTNVDKATSFYQYLNLVMCAERALPNFTPRMMLSLLRQIYYGHESWSRSSEAHWKFVIPCGGNIPSPEKILGMQLLQALKYSYQVKDTDIGHVFTGLEAMCCPRTSVDLSFKGLRVPVQMPNVEFATWGGDLGSAVAAKVFDEYDKGMPTQDWDKYLFGAKIASTADFNGDIDAYAIGAFLSASQCSAISKTAINQVNVPISQILYEYYLDNKTALARFRAQRIGCFVQGIGGALSGSGRFIVGDKPALYDSIARRVMSFARVYYTGRFRKDDQGNIILSLLNPYPSGIGTKILAYASQATIKFVHWLEGQL